MNEQANTPNRPPIYWLAVIAATVWIVISVVLFVQGELVFSALTGFAGTATARWAHQYEPPTRPAKRTRPRTNR